MQIDISEAAERLDELVDFVEAGGEVVLLLDGRPAGRLIPFERDGNSQTDPLR